MKFDSRELMNLVDEFNNKYNTDECVALSYEYCDGLHFIKLYGRCVWDSDNNGDYTLFDVKRSVQVSINRLLLPHLEEYLNYLRDDYGDRSVDDFFDEEFDSLYILAEK